MRFSLEPERWYACELIGDEFEEDMCSYTPIKVLRLEPRGDRTLLLEFYHANYPEGVRNKVYSLRTIERCQNFMLAKSLDHSPIRIMQIYEITYDWIAKHFPRLRPDSNGLQAWLDHHL
jgi:hypothetical protein